MTNGTNRGLLVVVVAIGLAGCHGASSSLPTAPSPPQSPVVPAVAACSRTGTSVSGVVSEVTPNGRVPIAGARVFLSDDEDQSTDSEGFFRFVSVVVCVPGQIVIWVGKDGYDDEAGQPAVPGFDGGGWRVVTVNGDTQLAITLVRR